MEKPRIYYIANAQIPGKRAHSIQIAKMCEAFALSGASVTLVLPKQRGSEMDVFAAYGLEKNFTVVRLPSVTVPLWLPGAFALQTVSFAFLVKRWLHAQKGTAIVYTRGEMAIFLAYRLPSQFRLVWETHIKPSHPKRYQRAVERASALVVTTKYYAQEIPTLWNSSAARNIYAPDGVSLKDFSNSRDVHSLRTQLSLPRDKKIILYAGSELAWKGVDILRKASNLLPEGYLVVFVGQITPDVTASPKRLFVGLRPHTEIAQWLAAADTLVLLGNPDSEIARHYTSPLKLFEYMASGVPIVATELPSFRDILSEAQAFFFTTSPESLAQTLEFVTNHKDEAALRARAAQNLVQQFSWERRAQLILSLLQKLP